MRFLIPPLVLCSVFLVSGCTTTKVETKMTGLFDDDLGKLMAAYDRVVKDQTTEPELKELGFDLHAPNVTEFPGPDACRVLFGEQCFDTAMRDGENFKKLLKQLSPYRMFVIPYSNIVEEEDRFYFSTQDTYRNGHDVMLLFVLEEDLVIYCAKKRVNIKEHSSESAFAEGLFKLVEKFGGTAGKINDLLKKVLGK